MGIWLLFFSPLPPAANSGVPLALFLVLFGVLVTLFFCWILLRYVSVSDSTIEVTGPFRLWPRTILISEIESFHVIGGLSACPAIELRTTTGRIAFSVNARFVWLLGHRTEKRRLKHAWRIRYWSRNVPSYLFSLAAASIAEAFSGYRTGRFFGRNGSYPVSDREVVVALVVGCTFVCMGASVWLIQRNTRIEPNPEV
jgi:hypothetical protein